MNNNENAHGDKKDKEFTIIVNTRQKTVSQEELTFAEIIALAYETPPTGAAVMFTVTYRRGHGNKPEGTMVEADAPLKLKEGMIINISATDKS